MNTPVFKVVILGDCSVGKTSLMHRYVNSTFKDNYKATIGSGFCSKSILVDGYSVTMQIWDTAGQERFHSLVAPFYRGADACVLVYDVTNQASFRSVHKWHTEFLWQTGHRDYEIFPFVLLGNKVDLPNRQITPHRAEEWCKANNGIPYFETSAKDGFNVDLAFQTIAQNVLAQLNSAQLYKDPIVLEEPKKRDSPCLC